MTDIIVYTCITGGYDQKLMQAPSETGISFVCFTDQPAKIQSSGWDVRPPQIPPALSRGHDINRFHKFFAHHLFPTARWSIYMDGNIRFDGQFRDLVEQVRSKSADIGAFWHPHGHSLSKEAEICALSKFDSWDFARVEKQLAAYASDGIDLNAPIPACYLLVRDHKATGLAAAMSLWWSQIFEYTKRDQISFSWILHQTQLKFQSLDGESGIDPARIDRVAHQRRTFWERAITKVKRALASRD